MYFNDIFQRVQLKWYGSKEIDKPDKTQLIIVFGGIVLAFVVVKFNFDDC